jgi:uncharacterized protein (TIGR02268 family)
LSLPAALAAAFVLLAGAEARAQPSPPREPRQRSVTVTGSPAEPPQTIHAAKGVATALIFKSQINGAAVEVDPARVKLLDAGERFVLFEPLVEPSPQAPPLVSVPFADGNPAARAVFVLVSSPSSVDTRLDVELLAPTLEACQTELAQAQARCSKSTPLRFVRDGWLGPEGVITRKLDHCRTGSATTLGLRCAAGTAYLADTWMIVAATFANAPGHPPWVPREVTLKSRTGAPWKARAVEWEPARIAPGTTGQVFVEAERPKDQEEFVLELRDAMGRGITIPQVKLSKEESKR